MKQKFHYGFAVLFLCIGLTIGFLIGYLRNVGGKLNAFDDLAVHDHNWSEVRQSEADSNLTAFRDNLAFANLSLHHDGKSKCIVHEPESALKYDQIFFPDFVATHCVKPGYKWSIGLYPEICREKLGGNNKYPRISIFMIPTMRNVDIKGHPKDIIDYFDARNTDDFKYYSPKTSTGGCPEHAEQLMPGTGGYTYDQGTIFP